MTRQQMAGGLAGALLVAIVVLHAVGAAEAVSMAEKLYGMLGMAVAALVGEVVAGRRSTRESAPPR